MSVIIEQFTEHGYLLVPDVLSIGECERIAAQVPSSKLVSGGTRRLLEHTWCRALVDRLRNHAVLAQLLPPSAVAVQCTWFEKSRGRNWSVPFHRDLSIPVAEKVENSSLNGWSRKEGCLFVQAPVSVLEQLVAVRLHLDPCGADDGALRVVPGSHRDGRADTDDRELDRRAEVVCEMGVGSTLVMRPILLHSSRKAVGDGRRRVLHFLFGPRELPYGLRWASVV